MIKSLLKEGVILLANRLKILLAERDLTIKDLMKATGLSRNSLSNMVNNPFANISTENVDKLCNYLEVAPKDFYDYSGWRFDYEWDTKSVPFSQYNQANCCAGIRVTMTSGKLVRSFTLFYNLEYDADYGDGGGHDVFIVAYNDAGSDAALKTVYKKMSPLFKHQIESELLQPVSIILEQANKRGEFDGNKLKLNVQFVYPGENDEIVFQDNFIFDRKNGDKTESEAATAKLLEEFRKSQVSKSDEKLAKKALEQIKKDKK